MDFYHQLVNSAPVTPNTANTCNLLKKIEDYDYGAVSMAPEFIMDGSIDARRRLQVCMALLKRTNLTWVLQQVFELGREPTISMVLIAMWLHPATPQIARLAVDNLPHITDPELKELLEIILSKYPAEILLDLFDGSQKGD